MSKLFLAIDLGSSACKVLAADARGREISAASAECRVRQPGPDQQVQDLEEVWRSAVTAVNKAVSKRIAPDISAIAFSSVMHGFMPVGKDSRPLMPMLTWADGRAQEEAQTLARKFGRGIYERTGCMPTALYHPARILWLKNHAPVIFKKAARFASIKDAIVHRLTGNWTVDKSHASSNGLLNIHKLSWDSPLLEAVGIGPERLPGLVEPDGVAGELSASCAKTLGLSPGLPVIAGAGDGGLANLGSGAMEPGQIAATIGTTGAMRKVLGRPWISPSRKIWCYYLASNLWYAGGAINSGGIIMRWMRDNLFAIERDAAARNGVDPYSLITGLAKAAGPGAAGLLFLPYLFGERTPYWNPEARGVIFGLAPHHGKAHIARAGLEGITYCLAHIFELLRGSPGGAKEIRASGGFARSDMWVQLFADVLGRPVALSKVKENSAMGAAILAMKATGAIKDLREGRNLVQVKKVFEPDLKKARFYQERFAMFKDLYDHLEPDFARWAKLQK